MDKYKACFAHYYPIESVAAKENIMKWFTREESFSLIGSWERVFNPRYVNSSAKVDNFINATTWNDFLYSLKHFIDTSDCLSCVYDPYDDSRFYICEEIALQM